MLYEMVNVLNNRTSFCMELQKCPFLLPNICINTDDQNEDCRGDTCGLLTFLLSFEYGSLSVK